jgi:hypothetical protein
MGIVVMKHENTFREPVSAFGSVGYFSLLCRLSQYIVLLIVTPQLENSSGPAFHSCIKQLTSVASRSLHLEFSKFKCLGSPSIGSDVCFQVLSYAPAFISVIHRKLSPFIVILPQMLCSDLHVV